MKRLNIQNICLLSICLISFSSLCYAQEGNITINQNETIPSLLELKKEINKDEKTSSRFKIQVFSGSRSNAEEIKSDFKTAFSEWDSKMVYETPNYKIWVGSFRTRLEADRALKKVKRKFPSAFIFEPKKEKQ